MLEKLGSSCSHYLPKYYIPVNMPGFDCKTNPLIMMDFLPDGNLFEYMKYRNKFVSLLTKVYILFSITMGLRVL